MSSDNEKILDEKESQLLTAMGLAEETPMGEALQNYVAKAGHDKPADEKTASKEDIIEALKTVSDPEIDINVYDMGLILSYNYNKVTSIRRSVTSITDLLSTTPLEGKPVDYVYAWRNAGLDENGEPMVYNRAGEKFSWMNMSDYLTLDDVDFVGRSTPPVFGSWNNKLSWNGFTLDFMFTYKFGHKIRKPYTARTFNSRDEMVHKSLADRWQQPGDEMHTWIPRVSDSAYESSQRMMVTIYSDKLLDDGAIIRLRSLNLGYNFATLLKNNTFVKDLNLKFTAENLFYWSKSGYDTDHILSTYSETNLDFPEARRYTFSLSLSF